MQHCVALATTSHPCCSLPFARMAASWKSSSLAKLLVERHGYQRTSSRASGRQRPRWLERAMSKRRLDEARVLAAVAANDPPASADHLDDDEWHAAQDKWLVKWSGSVLFDGLLQYGCSVLGGAPMVAAERQCRARQAGTAAEQHARRAADSLASKGRRKVLRAQPQHCRADAEAAVRAQTRLAKYSTACSGWPCSS